MSEQPLSAGLKDQLVAYLDGELDDDAARDVERLLSTDPRARQALRQLEAAWDLLDELPRAEVDPSFTESTIEIVAVSLEREIEHEQAAQPSRDVRKWGAAAAAVLAACLLGYLAVASVSADPNEQLLRDLPLLERLDEYRQVDDVQFLRDLHTASLLPNVQPQPEQPTTLADRRMLLQQMDPAAKEELKEKQQRFAELTADEKQQLRRLHDQLQADPDAAVLRGVMAAYHEWLLKLSPPQRGSLASADIPARVEKVRTLRSEEILRTADRAEPADMETIAAWIEKQVYERMSPDRQAAIEALKPSDRRGAVMLWAMFRPPNSPQRQPELSPSAIADLRSMLSPAGQAKLDAQPSDEARRKIVGDYWTGWIPQAMRDSVRKYFETLLADVPEDELVAYFEQLSEKEKEDLQRLSNDSRDQRLRMKYVMEHRRDRLPEHVRSIKPEMLGWLRWGRGDGRWSGFRDREPFRGGEGPPPFMGSPPEVPRPRRP